LAQGADNERKGMNKLKGLAIGIGSLPYTEEAPALDLIFKYLPETPFWPQLPKRDIREGMVAQFSQNLPCLKMTSDGIFYDPKNQEHELEIFYEQIISNNLDYFKIGPDFASGLFEFYTRLEKANLEKVEFIKCQITGPITFAASIKDNKGVALLHDPVFLQVITKGLIMKALWQIKLFSKFGKKIIVFLDEPYLSGFGSAFTPIDKASVVKELSEVADGIKTENTLVGVHCCGNTDWSIFTDIKSIDIINFDAFSFMDKFTLYAKDLAGFLKRNGIICWGVVPTQEFTGEETAGSLVDRVKQGIGDLVKKGVNKGLAADNLLVSPSCGLGALDPLKAEKILKLLFEASAILRNSP